MTETEQQRDGRVLAEAVLFNLVCSIEHEISRLYIFVFKDLRDMHKERLDRELKDAKDALEWAKGMVDVELKPGDSGVVDITTGKITMDEGVMG